MNTSHTSFFMSLFLKRNFLFLCYSSPHAFCLRNAQRVRSLHVPNWRAMTSPQLRSPLLILVFFDVLTFVDFSRRPPAVSLQLRGLIRKPASLEIIRMLSFSFDSCGRFSEISPAFQASYFVTADLVSQQALPLYKFYHGPSVPLPFRDDPSQPVTFGLSNLLALSLFVSFFHAKTKCALA